ncbi:MAG: HAD family hydrolase [Clostridia bacterium]|nr:HAD family hydrolase [Clostridia bacterium]
MKQYKCLIFDADHTLLDYLADERAAFDALYDELHMQKTDELFSFSRNASESTWIEAGMYDVHDKTVQGKYHQVYRTHVEGIFAKIFEKFGAPKSGVTAKEAGEKFLRYLEREGALLPFAEETLAALSKKSGGNYEICIATNGIIPIQTGRLKRLSRYAHGIYISEAVGAIKPLPEFFEKIVTEMRVNPFDCLMIGDSLSSDVAGAKRSGMDSCWFNPENAENDTPFLPDYEIKDLQELLKFL